MKICDSIAYVGVNDHDIDLFEGQYDVRENGMSYNSYVVFGSEKVVVTDSVDARFVDEWLGNLEAALAGRPTISSSITWSPTTRPASPRLPSAIPRLRSWPLPWRSR